MTSSIVGRLGLPALVLAVTTGFVATAPTASAAPQAASPEASATWLTHQLTRGVIHDQQYDFDDYGLTADTGFALAAIEGQSPALRKLRKALGKHVRSWTTGVDFGSTDVYAGSTAKALVFAQTTGADRKSLGGVNLAKQLAALVTASGPAKGRIHDQSTDDFANTIGQAYAANGLAAAGSPSAKSAINFLLEQQCSKGFFRLYFADASAADQSCDGAPKAERAPDTDATALAVVQLLSLEKPNRKVRTAVGDAVAWLRNAQEADGSFGGGPATEASNANSTGLAGYALAQAGYCPAASRASTWIAKLQITGNLAGTPLEGESGAIAYDRKALDAAKKHGIGVKQRDQFRRATAQAAPALLYRAGVGCPG